MFVNKQLQDHLEQSSSVSLKSLVTAEWNMNIPSNISIVGNYRNRPSEPGSPYNPAISVYDPEDYKLEFKHYTDATDSDIAIPGGYEDYLDDQLSPVPMAFSSKKQKEKMLYSLDDCLLKFRPRSGINKARFLNNVFLHHTNSQMASRPRYYMAGKNDNFKYWSSYRTESVGSQNIERGISGQSSGQSYFIDDAAPFVVYKDAVPANRIVVKMQTGVGSVDLGPFQTDAGTTPDPLFGYANQKTPVRWRIQYLKNNSWYDAISFDENSKRLDGTKVIGPDGYVEISYGPIIPEKYLNTFRYIGEIYDDTIIPAYADIGDAYLVKSSLNDAGRFVVVTDSGQESFSAKYGWYLEQSDITRRTAYVKKLTSPDTYVSSTGEQKFREIEYISGIRILVDTMNVQDATFDLIEISPRLMADISDMTTNFKVNRAASDLGSSGMPVGQLLAATGSLGLFDPDQVFNTNNTDSIISKYQYENIKFSFYEIVRDVETEGILYDYYVPIKTMYSETKPNFSTKDRSISIELRDFFFHLEGTRAPELLLQDASTSYAVSLLLDSIGFSNYVFKRMPGEQEDVIPYFFVAPNKTVAEVLQDIAVSTQTAMFFDEFNNFVVMSREYLMPSSGTRPINTELIGSIDQAKDGIVSNMSTNQKLSNIQDIAMSQTNVYNSGKISYTTRYIQREMASLRQAMLTDTGKTWVYKPALLWEVSPSGNVKSINDKTGDQQSFLLSAIPLNTSLSSKLPEVIAGRVENNIIDFGEGVQWVGRYNGYFYSNGEVIRYDAVEYSVPGVAAGNVWISSIREYQTYFSKLPFNGKIYPTGRVRIFSIPNYVQLQDGTTILANGPVAQHGRGQFGTKVVDHTAGVNPYWYDNKNIRGVAMDHSKIFYQNDTIRITEAQSAPGETDGEYVVIVSSTELVKVGQKVEIVQGTGQFEPGQIASVTQVVDNTHFKVDRRITTPLQDATLDLYTKRSEPTTGKAGKKFSNGTSNTFAQKTTRNGIIKNFQSYFAGKESTISNLKVTEPGVVQSSALVVNGPSFKVDDSPMSFVSYVYKPLPDKFKHFGTRMRIIGKVEDGLVRSQTPVGVNPYYQLNQATPDKELTVGGSSGGLAISINPETNNGYYFEIISLTAADSKSYADGDGGVIHNIIFYKLGKSPGSTSEDDLAHPIKLWGGSAEILSDSGSLVSKSRLTAENKTTVYDISVEYEEVGTTLRFSLYINGRLLAVVDDPNPELSADKKIVTYNNLALFVRGSSRVMFENVYAIQNNYSQNTAFALNTPISQIFGDSEIDVSEAMRKYAMSGIIQSTYLSGLGPQEPPRYNIYFEEFGTIMREAAYFDIKYDKAYPALYSQISPTFNKVKGYTISGFTGGAYGAEFLVFNATDTHLSLDSSSGNYLRIQGIAFTQESQQALTVDDYFTQNSNFANQEFLDDGIVRSPLRSLEKYQGIKFSRMTDGVKEFTMDPVYVQSHDAASSLMGWLIEKTIRPRLAVGMKIFSMPTIQLGDLVTIQYSADDVEQVAGDGKVFVVYNIEYSRNSNGPEMTVYAVEV